MAAPAPHQKRARRLQKPLKTIVFEEENIIFCRPGYSPGACATAPDTYKNHCFLIGQHGFLLASAPPRMRARRLQKPIKTMVFRPSRLLPGARLTALETYTNNRSLIGNMIFFTAPALPGGAHHRPRIRHKPLLLRIKHAFWPPRLLRGGARDSSKNHQKPLLSTRKTWFLFAPAACRIPGTLKNYCFLIG